jgi:hypothetical protein
MPSSRLEIILKGRVLFPALRKDSDTRDQIRMHYRGLGLGCRVGSVARRVARRTLKLFTFHVLRLNGSGMEAFSTTEEMLEMLLKRVSLKILHDDLVLSPQLSPQSSDIISVLISVGTRDLDD